MSHFVEVRARVGRAEPKHFKDTLFRSPRLMIGVNCLDPGQSQRVHTHPDQDKFYYVVEGDGVFTVGDETRSAGPGTVIWAPSGREHGVENEGDRTLVILMGIAPAPGNPET